jgi:hypothetical protein
MPTPSLTALSREALLERWQEIISDHDLVEAPERIETDAYGNILMSPPPMAIIKNAAIASLDFLKISSQAMERSQNEAFSLIKE